MAKTTQKPQKLKTSVPLNSLDMDPNGRAPTVDDVHPASPKICDNTIIPRVLVYEATQDVYHQQNYKDTHNRDRQFEKTAILFW